MKIIRAFARFIDEVLQDYARAQSMRAEAERLERFAEANTRGKSHAGAVSDKRDAVVVINSSGIITIANKNAHVMFGCAVLPGNHACATCVAVTPLLPASAPRAVLLSYLTTCSSGTSVMNCLA